jgi:hypothetical protein
MSTKVLVVGDIHNKHIKAEKIMSAWDGLVIQLGDIFDDFYDNPNDVTETALWFKESLKKQNRIHLMGNHDIHYMLPVGSGIFCSGYTPEKHRAIKEVLSLEDWEQVKYFHSINNCWFSHAGITRQWFQHPVHGITVEGIEARVKHAADAFKSRNYGDTQCLYAADQYRGGMFKKGGLLWNDWNNIDYIENVTQIVGHTPRRKVTCKKDTRKMSININIDTHLKHAIILDTTDSTYEVLKY